MTQYREQKESRHPIFKPPRRGLKINPLQHFVLVKRLESKRKGFCVPNFAPEKSARGTVIAASSGAQLKNCNSELLEVKTGDRILFDKSVGQSVKVDGADFLIMRDDEIAAVIEA